MDFKSWQHSAIASGLVLAVILIIVWTPPSTWGFARTHSQWMGSGELYGQQPEYWMGAAVGALSVIFIKSAYQMRQMGRAEAVADILD